jgi:colanic acid biosynthesis glycosyl transferase WcaI
MRIVARLVLRHESRRVMNTPRRFVVLCPHFAPDIAPTGRVMTQLVEQWAALGHEIHVVTSLPWYREHRVEAAWRGRLVRRERTAWGSVTRIHPLAGTSKTNIVARALAFVAFSKVAGVCASFAGRSRGKRIDAVIAMSPPLTLGLVGAAVASLRRARFIFNVQDVFPDAVVKTGAVRNKAVIAAAAWLERFVYRRADSVVVLSDDLRRNVQAKLPASDADCVHVIENFVDTNGIVPCDRMTGYRRELCIADEVVVMYAGNVGFSQSLGMLVDYARHRTQHAARDTPNVVVVINGAGAALDDLRAQAKSLTNVRFGAYQPEERLAEVLATGDIHVVPLRAGLASVSVPSKTYSILAAGRCIVAAVDRDSEIDRLVTASGAGICVAPDDPAALRDALDSLVADAARRSECGRSGREFVQRRATARDVAEAYVRLVPDSLSDS